MPKSHRPHRPEFRQRIVELVRKGWMPEDMAWQFEPSAQAIRNWVRQADRDDGHRLDPGDHAPRPRSIHALGESRA